MRALTVRVDPRPMAAARIGVGLASLVIATELWVTLYRAGGAWMAAPVFSWLPVVTEGRATAWFVLMLAAGQALTYGWCSRAAAATVSALVAGALLWDQQVYSSHVLLLCLLCAYMSLGRPGAAWGLDARGRPRGAVPFWPQLLMMTQLSVLYFFAAVSKVNGVFLGGAVLESSMRLALPDAVFRALAVATVVTELFLAVALWLPRVRLVAFAVGLGLHVSIVVGMDDSAVLLGFALLCVPCYPLFHGGQAARTMTRGRLAPTIGAAVAGSAATPASFQPSDPVVSNAFVNPLGKESASETK